MTWPNGSLLSLLGFRTGLSACDKLSLSKPNTVPELGRRLSGKKQVLLSQKTRVQFSARVGSSQLAVTLAPGDSVPFPVALGLLRACAPPHILVIEINGCKRHRQDSCRGGKPLGFMKTPTLGARLTRSSIKNYPCFLILLFFPVNVLSSQTPWRFLRFIGKC